jgi:hypothetical protein
MSGLKVAFYGGMANNCYMTAKRMRELGVDAYVVRDHLDNFAISQPMWEDHRFWLPYEELLASSSWTSDAWDRQAEQLGWTAPPWLVDPRMFDDQVEPDFSDVDGVDLGNYTPAPADHYKKILGFFRTCDIIFVSNVHAIILALVSKRPFVICPAGGEFMIATGQISAVGDIKKTYDLQAKLLLTAFTKTRAVLTNTHFLQHAELTGGLSNLRQNFDPHKFKRISLPFVPTKPTSRTEKASLMKSLLLGFDLPAPTTPFSVFVPSRVDFRWKGQHLLMEAIQSTAASHNFTFIFSGWGEDFKLLQAWSAGRSNVRIIPAAVSKPLLFDFYRASDLTVDQFVLGHIGTAAREAASVGSPVMAYVKTSIGARATPDLPVINAHTAGQIGQHLDNIASRRYSLERQCERGLDWIRQFASPLSMKDALLIAGTSAFAWTSLMINPLANFSPSKIGGWLGTFPSRLAPAVDARLRSDHVEDHVKDNESC